LPGLPELLPSFPTFGFDVFLQAPQGVFENRQHELFFRLQRLYPAKGLEVPIDIDGVHPGQRCTCFLLLMASRKFVGHPQILLMDATSLGSGTTQDTFGVPAVGSCRDSMDLPNCEKQLDNRALVP